MRTLRRRGRTIIGTLALTAVALLALAASASAATFPTAHTNSATTNLSDIGADMTANSPASVAPGDAVSLSSIDQTLSIPPDIFVTGYCLFGAAGLVTEGLNTFPANTSTEIEATNTVEGTQRTDTASDVGEFTITDPTPLPCNGDETSTAGELSYTYADQTWTADGSPGSIEFRMDTAFDGTTLLPTPTANGVLIDAIIGGVLGVQFRGAPGVVDEAGTAIIYDDPAVSFASTTIEAANQAPVADAGADQTVASEQAGVSLDGSGSSDPDGDPLTYSWSQTAGTPVSLDDPSSATPSFDAPVGPDTLEFELTVDDGELNDADTVVVNVNEPVVENQPPVADAGADQTVASEQAGVSLDGSGSSDPDGDPLTYSWSQTAGTPVSLDDPSSATPSFDAPVGPDTLEFELTVDDGELNDADTVVVNVNEPVVENQPPVADAGADQTVASEQAGVSLDGSGSTDPDGDPLTYSWSQTAGTPVSLDDPSSATPSFDAPVGPDTLEFELTVDDGELNDADTVVVNVNEPVVENQPPVADAGADQTVASEQAGVSLDGSGSSDPDGDPLTYSWSQTAGTPVSLDDPSSATPSFDAPVGPDTLEFELTVDDGELNDADTVVVNVNEPVVENQPPVADAGADQTVASEQAGVSLDGSGSSDPDGDPLTYSWSQTAGTPVSLDDPSSATPSFDAPVGPDTLEFELTVDDGELNDADTVVVNVNEPVVENQPPVADAGADQTVASEQAGVSLDGSGSSDPDGDPLTYSWSQTAGTPVSLDDPSSATPSFDAPVGPDTLEFELTVDDGELNDADTVVVNVNEPVQPPVFKNAAKACKAERKEDPDAFKEKYGTNKNGKNAFGKCVSSKKKKYSDKKKKKYSDANPRRHGRR